MKIIRNIPRIHSILNILSGWTRTAHNGGSAHDSLCVNARVVHCVSVCVCVCVCVCATAALC